jgi:hypothetical protein
MGGILSFVHSKGIKVCSNIVDPITIDNGLDGRMYTICKNKMVKARKSGFKGQKSYPVTDIYTDSLHEKRGIIVAVPSTQSILPFNSKSQACHYCWSCAWYAGCCMPR